MTKKILSILLTGILVFGMAGCGWFESPAASTDVIEINPQAAAANKDTVSVNLYFGSGDDYALIGETRVIDAPVNERLEMAVVSELIKGPSSSKGEFSQLINPKTEVIDISDNGETLFVTLSKEFLTPVDTGGNEDTTTDKYIKETKQKMRLAVYSIVDTLIELSGYPRVQILIDEDGSGNGSRVSKSKVGFDGEGSLEPLERNGDIILTPKNTVKMLLDVMESKDWSRVYNLISSNDTYDTQKPSETDFEATIASLNLMVEDYEILDEVVFQTDVGAVVLVNYDIKTKDEDTQSRTNIPVMLVRENDIWKIQYSTFAKLFLDI